MAPGGKRFRIGVDLGGTKLAVGVVDSGGTIVGESVTHDHRGLSEEEVLVRIERNVDAALSAARAARADVKGVGVLFPGHIRWPEGVTLTTSNLPGFKGFPLREMTERRLGIPCLADNDANAQAIGEYQYGAGVGMDPMVLLTVSTGIGGGIIIDGKPYRGFTGTAGEFGHMIIDTSEGKRCTCGNYGCFMGAASGLAIPGAARQLAERLRASGACADLPSGCEDFAALDGAMLAAGCAEGNELCRAVVEDFARYTGVGLYNIFQVLNPRGIVLGGGLLNLPEFFFEEAVSTCYRLAGSMMHDRMEIRRGLLGGRSGVIGAAALFEA
ncbi:MAG TPA: ROK family protein [Rectinemataceae bacterium]|nr:ROK family protein [Rectinemataceae bacterium]